MSMMMMMMTTTTTAMMVMKCVVEMMSKQWRLIGQQDEVTRRHDPETVADGAEGQLQIPKWTSSNDLAKENAGSTVGTYF